MNRIRTSEPETSVRFPESFSSPFTSPRGAVKARRPRKRSAATKSTWTYSLPLTPDRGQHRQPIRSLRSADTSIRIRTLDPVSLHVKGQGLNPKPGSVRFWIPAGSGSRSVLDPVGSGSGRFWRSSRLRSRSLFFVQPQKQRRSVCMKGFCQVLTQFQWRDNLPPTSRMRRIISV